MRAYTTLRLIECVYQHAWGIGSKAKAGVRKRISFYNHKHPNSTLGGKPPTTIYWQQIKALQFSQQVQRVA